MAAAPEVHEHAAGLTWVHADEGMARAWHAVGDAEGVWLVDPIDDAGAVERAQAVGPIRGVVQLLDRHERAGGELSKRLGVPLHRLPDALPRTPFEVRTVVDIPKWREKALWWPERSTLVVAETLGTNDYFRFSSDAVGIHPFLRVLTPGALRGFAPELLLPGHGAPLAGPEVPAAIEAAYAHAKRDLLRTPLKLRALLGAAR